MQSAGRSHQQNGKPHNDYQRRARRDFNRQRAQMAASIAGSIAVYDALTVPWHEGKEKDTRMSREEIARHALGIADEIIRLIQEGERF